MSGYTLWGDGVSADDIEQGACGNCWVLAAASAIADNQPDKMKSIFLNQDHDLNKAGIYAVTLYPLGVPHTVVVDDYLHVKAKEGY